MFLLAKYCFAFTYFTFAMRFAYVLLVLFLYYAYCLMEKVKNLNFAKIWTSPSGQTQKNYYWLFHVGMVDVTKRYVHTTIRHVNPKKAPAWNKDEIFFKDDLEGETPRERQKRKQDTRRNHQMQKCWPVVFVEAAKMARKFWKGMGFRRVQKQVHTFYYNHALYLISELDVAFM